MIFKSPRAERPRWHPIASERLRVEFGKLKKTNPPINFADEDPSNGLRCDFLSCIYLLFTREFGCKPMDLTIKPEAARLDPHSRITSLSLSLSLSSLHLHLSTIFSMCRPSQPLCLLFCSHAVMWPALPNR